MIEAFAVSQNAFDKRLPALLKNFNKWQGEDKSKYLDQFSNVGMKLSIGSQKGVTFNP